MSTTLLGTYVQESRFARRWSYGDLARAIGYKNLSKGSRRLQTLEYDGVEASDFIEKVIAALELDPKEVNLRIAEDRRRWTEEWNAWADEPILPELNIKPIAGFWLQRRLEARLNKKELIAKAREESRSYLEVALVVSRRLTLWFSKGEITNWIEATPGSLQVPFMTIGRSKNPIVFVQGRERGDDG